MDEEDQDYLLAQVKSMAEMRPKALVVAQWYDRDKDGFISKKEAQLLPGMGGCTEVTSCGVVSCHLILLLTQDGPDPEGEWQNLLSMVDTNQDGKVPDLCTVTHVHCLTSDAASQISVEECAAMFVKNAELVGQMHEMVVSGEAETWYLAQLHEE